MNYNKKSFIIYCDNEVIVGHLPDDEAGMLFKSLFSFVKERIKPEFLKEHSALAMAFDIIAMSIVRNDEKYAERCEKNRENGRKGGLAKASNSKQSLGNGKQGLANLADNDSDNDSDRDKDKKEREKKFIPPTVEAVENYCQSKGYDVNPQRFVDFYESKGWMIGKNKMKDWKAAVRTWVRRDDSNQRQQAFNPISYDLPQEYQEMYDKYLGNNPPGPDDPFQ